MDFRMPSGFLDLMKTVPRYAHDASLRVLLVPIVGSLMPGDDLTPRTAIDSGHRDLIIAEARRRDHGDVAVIATDARGVILYWSAAAESLYGWRADDALGRDILAVTPTRGSSEEAATIMEELRHGRLWTGMFILQQRDGTPIMVHVTDVPIRDEGEVVGIVGVSRAAERENR